jgi:NAD(P)-dependent dehydrogenase (short-subunit alcohol dehydrogenase family)
LIAEGAHQARKTDYRERLSGEMIVGEVERHKTRVAVVTGSTGGIGEGIAHRLANDGFAVVVSGRRAKKGEEVVGKIADRGGTAIFLPANITDPKACRNLIDTAVDRYGRLDVLVNNAGIFPIAEIQDTSAEMWDEVFVSNVRGPFVCAQAAIPHLKNQGGGAIVNIGSTTTFRGGGNRIAYASSKGALLTMTKGLARALLADRIRVNWVTVGWVETEGEIELRDRHEPGGSGREFLDKASTNAPMGRLETVEDIAAGVAYLVSDAASHVTGCELNISGGLWI